MCIRSDADSESGSRKDESGGHTHVRKISRISSSPTLVTIPEENNQNNIGKLISRESSKPDVTCHENDTGLSSRRGSQALSSIQKIFTFYKTPDTSRATSDASIHLYGDTKYSELALKARQKNRKNANDTLSTAISALYAKFVIILGLSLPLTELLSRRLSSEFYQLFYLFLYTVGCVFIAFVYLSRIRMKSRGMMVGGILKITDGFGSFYLRVGAILFGIGEMVYSGLEFGQYFEARCE